MKEQPEQGLETIQKAVPWTSVRPAEIHHHQPLRLLALRPAQPLAPEITRSSERDTSWN